MKSSKMLKVSSDEINYMSQGDIACLPEHAFKIDSMIIFSVWSVGDTVFLSGLPLHQVMCARPLR